MRKITVAPMLAFAIMLAIAPSMATAEEWQTVETWGNIYKTPGWQTVETWTNYTNVTYVVGRPILVSPDNNSTITDNTPTFQWIAGATASSHRFLLDDDDAFSSPIVNILLGGLATTYTVATPLSDDNYWWKVVAILSGIENSSNVYKFTMLSTIVKNWQSVETWGDSVKSRNWENVEIWTTYLPTVEIGDYPAKGADYLHSGVANIVDDPPFEFLWKKNILGTHDEFSGPIVVGYKVWIANKGDNIFRCLGLNSGSEIWSYQLNTGTDGAPLWFDDKIYVGTGSTDSGSLASLYSFNADNGDLLWKHDGYNNNYFTSTPWINADNRIIYWVDGKDLLAFNADNGDLIWSKALYTGNHPFVGVYYDGITYTPGVDGLGLVAAYCAENGDFLWAINGTVWDSGITIDTSDADNVRLYVAQSNPAQVWCINPKTGENYWVRLITPYGTTNRYMLGVPAVWENKIYVTSGGGAGNKGVYCLYAENGETKWSWHGYDAATVYSSITVLPSGKIIYVTHGGTVHIRGADNGALLWSYPLAETSFGGHVAVVGGVFLLVSDGHLWAFGSEIGYEWQTVETWGDSLEIEEEEEPPPPPPPDYIPWVVFIIRFLSIFGPFGFVAWQFTKIRDPVTGARTAVWVGVGFVAFVLLWFVVDAVEAILYSI